MIKIAETRAAHKSANQKLRRMRHLYALFVKKSVEELRDEALTAAAQRMLDVGLFVKGTPLRHAKFSILRHMSKIDGCGVETLSYKGMSWGEWCMKNRWRAYHWTTEERKVVNG